MNEIVRGTTPTLYFELPFATDLLATGYVVVKQKDETVIEKELAACECEGTTLSTKLSQADTLALETGHHAKIRLVVKSKEEERFETDDFLVRVRDTHKDEVI